MQTSTSSSHFWVQVILQKCFTIEIIQLINQFLSKQQGNFPLIFTYQIYHFFFGIIKFAYINFRQKLFYILIQHIKMISFRFKSQVKRVKIKTRQKLDERMSHWLQKVFSFKNQIIGFKTQDNKVYDVESFYNSVQRFFGSNVDIIEAGDQLQISFTSQNLNSSSFIRPSQPNTSQINHKQLSDDQFQDFIHVSDRKSFEKKLIDGKDVSLLFDVNAIYRKTLSENSGNLLSTRNNFKINLYMYINNSHPKKSCLSIYIGKSCVITFPLVRNYIQKVKSFLSRYKNSSILAQRENKLFVQARASHQQEDEAPSFTTYHLQQRLNQQTCFQYLTKMHKQQKSLRNYEYRKLLQKCQENFNEFYRIFCEGVLDNDYQSFRNQILHKVDNNLELILSNVDDMDLSRPISREQQRRNNLKKSVPEIEIVKVQNYFEILDQLKKQIDSESINQIKQLLLYEDEQIGNYFSQYLSRQITQQVLAFRLNNALSRRKSDRNRPNSRYLASRPMKSKSVDPVRRKYSQEQKQQSSSKFNTNTLQHQNTIEQPPMFGSTKNQQNCSPVQYMSDMQSNYKQAWNKLSQRSEQFQPQEYGLLYYYLQKRDDSISNCIQQLDWNQHQSLENIKKLLREKMQTILMENFTPLEINFLDSVRRNHSINCVYENFRYESDLPAFLANLKQELEKAKPLTHEIKMLHKKSSDSQLLENKEKKKNRYGRRKYSDENSPVINPRSPSPKDSQYSLCNKQNQSQIPDLMQTVRQQWNSQFEQMLKDISFSENNKQKMIRDLYRSGNAKIFGWVRNYMKGYQQYFSSQQIYDLKEAQTETKFLISVLPIYDQFLRLFVQDGLLTQKVRKWIIGQVLSQNMTIISAFQLYLQTKQQQDFVQTLALIYQHQNQQMQFYNTYIKRLQALLKEMSINDQVGLQVFAQFPNSIKAICQLYFITGNLQDMMDTLQVLYQKQQQLRNLKCATLNFSGINTSPFQYHDGSQEADQLNHLFKQNIQRERPGMKKWNIGKIDKQAQNRMNISYPQHFQLADDGQLPNRAQFSQIWRKSFPKSQTFKTCPSQQQKAQCITLDYINYLTVIQYVYEMQNLGITSQQFQQKIKQFSPRKLTEYLQQKQNKPQCKVQMKEHVVLDYLLRSNIDVLFLQQAGSIDWSQQLVKQYTWVKNSESDSVIIYKKEKIGAIKNSMMEVHLHDFGKHFDAACLFSDKGYLLVSAHLKSHKQHIEQSKAMFEVLQKVLHDHPMLKMVIGIDANHFIKQQNIPEDMKVKRVPLNDQIPTTLKKRTFLQAQYQKADVQVSQVKDLIITNRRIQNFRIQTVEGKEIQKQQEKKQFIPNSKHPYDHFIVLAEIV